MPTSSASRFRSLRSAVALQGLSVVRPRAMSRSLRCRRFRGSRCLRADRAAAIHRCRHLRTTAASRLCPPSRPIVGPIEPMPLICDVQRRGPPRRHFTATLPLPFGLIAHLDSRGSIGRAASRRSSATATRCSSISRNSAHGVAGGTQLTIAGPPNTIPDSRDRPLPGWVELVAETDYAKGVLSENIHTAFGEDFGSFGSSVPVRRYELSGYGASMRSDWRDPRPSVRRSSRHASMCTSAAPHTK